MASMIQNIGLQSARKGGPGSGFSDPNCRRGIPRQRGGSINICEPGGLAKAAALGVDISDTDMSESDFTEPFKRKQNVAQEELKKIQEAVRERIDEPNKVTRREILRQQLNIPLEAQHKLDREYSAWSGGPGAAGELWEAAAYLQGLEPEIALTGIDTPGLSREEAGRLAKALAIDREISRLQWKNGNSVWRGLKVRDDRVEGFSKFADWVESASPDATVLLPNNFLESWTDDYDEAEQFAKAWRPSSDRRGLVLESRPVLDDILVSHGAVDKLASEREHILTRNTPFTPYKVGDIQVV